MAEMDTEVTESEHNNLGRKKTHFRGHFKDLSYIEDKKLRQTSVCKRRKTLLSAAHDLHRLTGASVFVKVKYGGMSRYYGSNDLVSDFEGHGLKITKGDSRCVDGTVPVVKPSPQKEFRQFMESFLPCNTHILENEEELPLTSHYLHIHQ
ncbi:uncharacterized protein LOC102810330 [Saccoglossus kowalevskii]|uniref:Uncharacterized protein LOC102810330 n=1 Tax=Saccoglossus kowalevskii TaxID=10224 RepID=A0ABM0LVR1_SACKO|nr:PREDICTED: uncharacterized protein LOC102810330 [Saccoglossus kowalevskii]